MLHLITSFISLFLAFASNYGSSYILSHLNLSQQPANDFLLLNVPRLPFMGYIADSILIITTIILFYSFRHNFTKISFSIYSISVILFIRSFLVLLTPINNSYGMFEYSDLFSFGSYPSGMFPSGHTAFVFLCYLLLKKSKLYSKILFLLLVLEIIALISSHGHYSIDIIGGLMLSYIVFRLGQDLQNKAK